MNSEFFRYELRTTDMDAARAFYSEVLGSGFWDSGVCVSPLPERAKALGAPSHWVGHIGIGGVEGTVDRIVAQGGQRLGPAQQGADGSTQVLKDPFGAVLAVSSPTQVPSRSPVAWHLHHSEDDARSFAFYAELFGWTATERLDLGPEQGCHQMFAWSESGETVGAMANTARLPHIHPQWMFFFPVVEMEEALARVRAGGGIVLGPMRTSTGDIVSPCDDPQGAAFALYQPRPDGVGVGV